jgi:murein DD-endopeptidase MepM/ murein hydrolase activator NlpD
MSLTIKRIIIVAVFLTVTAYATVAAFVLLLVIFRLGIFVRHDAAATSPLAPEARSSPRASPRIDQSPKAPLPPAPPVGHETPENRDEARPARTPVLIKSGELIIPVAGVRPDQLRDTYNESRSEGRTHNALDIMAGCDTPVVATIPGKIIKLFRSERGGVTIYQMSADDRTVYYYAHLARYAEGLTEGHFAQQGEVIGYVGDTGNVTPGACHLHFAIWTVADPKRYWHGENINPYPLLRPSP